MNTPCPKCLSSDVYLQHRCEGDRLLSHSTISRGRSSEFVNREGLGWEAKKECLTHTCRSCGWYWDTDVAPTPDVEKLKSHLACINIALADKDNAMKVGYGQLLLLRDLLECMIHVPTVQRR